MPYHTHSSELGMTGKLSVQIIFDQHSKRTKYLTKEPNQSLETGVEERFFGGELPPSHSIPKDA